MKALKTDLAIYSHAIDVHGQFMSESLILGHNLDFSSCNIMVSFCKSSDKFSCDANMAGFAELVTYIGAAMVKVLTV